MNFGDFEHGDFTTFRAVFSNSLLICAIDTVGAKHRMGRKFEA
jgi:hypothetical protein